MVRSPGRVNLIGEHTDYNEGFVLPAAINKEIFFAMAPNKTKSLRVHAYELGEDATYDLDQFASIFGRRNHALKLDCRSLEYHYYNMDMQDYRIVLCDTQVKHSLASSEYNTRRQECEAGVSILRRHYPRVRGLRDATLEMLARHQQEFAPEVYRRCTYVVSENNRVEEACQDLERGA